MVPIKLAATLGDRVVLNAPVRTIARSGGDYVLRIRTASVPLGNAARTTRAVNSGTPTSARGSSDIPLGPPTITATMEDQRHPPARITPFSAES
jgi:hypothetical protein